MPPENNEDDDDGWDWPMLMYLSIKYLHWSEEQFWSETPRKFLALVSAAIEFQSLMWGGKKQEKRNKTANKVLPNNYGSLDNLPGWD